MSSKREAAITLTPDGLARLFAAARVPLPGDGLILFALRGCLPAPMRGWRTSVRLRPVPVDYLHMRCTLGIWDRAGRRLYAAPGSTVPQRDQVRKGAARGGKGVNQMEPGFYLDLTKGEHLQGKRNGHQALRQTAYRFYRRSPGGRPYSAQSPLYYGNPYDNLHCGWNADGRGPGYSSAGCLVVAGLPHCRRHEEPVPNQGPWKIFHDLIYGRDQRRFPLLLLPAADARRALANADRPLLVFGSEGEEVADLQRRLARAGIYRGRATGRLDARTYRAWKC